MSSQLFKVWELLQGRNDLPATLHEIIGQHALRCAFQDEFQSNNESYRAVGWIKIIFDLQRCYLSGITSGSSEIPPHISSCLVPPGLLFSSVLYLISTKTSMFPSQTTLMTKEFTQPRLVLAQTILSGLRLLLLHKKYLSLQMRRRLQVALEDAWKDDHLRGVEGCIVQRVFGAMLDAMNELNHVDAYRVEREHANLPKYASGLYPLHIKPERSVTPLMHALAEEDEDWVDAYCVLYDTLWAIECAVTQRYIDLRQHHRTNELETSIIETDEIFEQLYQQRSSFIVSVFHFKGSLVPTNAMLESLAINLLDWDTSLDNFLARQDSLLQQRMSLPQVPSRTPNYSKHIAEIKPYLEAAMSSFAIWLSNRIIDHGTLSTPPRTVSEPTESGIRNWVDKMASDNANLYSQQLEGPDLPVYVVGCPKLHVVPKKYLAYQLRWSDKYAYDSISKDSPIVNWKEGVQCPSCASAEKIKCARLLEPLQIPSTIASSVQQDTSQSLLSGEGTNSYAATSISAISHSISDGGSASMSFPGHSSMNVSVPTSVSQPNSNSARSKSLDVQLPEYTESPISPITLGPSLHTTRSYGYNMADVPISPLVESLNIPIPLVAASRLSIDLPIPVHTPSTFDGPSTGTSTSLPLDRSDTRLGSSSSALSWSTDTYAKTKPPSRSARIASSIRRKPSTKDSTVFPKDTTFLFSSSGRSLFLWSKFGAHVTRFDILSEEPSTIQGCRYDVASVEAVAAGDQKCAIITSLSASKKRLLIYDGLYPTPESEVELEVSGRIHGVCIAVSKDDKYVAVSTSDQIDIFNLESGLKKIVFHQQLNVYELRGGVSHRRSISVARTTSDDSVTDNEKTDSGSWFGAPVKALNVKEAAEEQQRQAAIISRKLYFSTDSQRLVVATQLGDHCVHVDVWDNTREPVSTISEHSRSFKLPPWVLNDGDLTGVFYDSDRRSALVTAFLGKEYPVLIPFPGYGPLQNETFSTKVISAAQSPSGSTFIITNAMTEIIQFEYTAKGTLSPRKLKKSSSKMSTSVFRPGAIALSIPTEDLLQAFWVKDGKCMLRTIKLSAGEAIKDLDLRPHYDRLMDLKERPIIARAPSLSIPEMDAGEYV
ncbi:hypothetical protein GQ44DRAFT_712987 [Phaeosphaeriaceae sp. PMI808]|nr:hypothetical protein GQ44DRAFT_712987 [Phaeosphaeriaceae sp. PMI808]